MKEVSDKVSNERNEADGELAHKPQNVNVMYFLKPVVYKNSIAENDS